MQSSDLRKLLRSHYPHPLGRPAVVFASAGRATTVLRRETPADMMQLDVWPSRQEDS